MLTRSNDLACLEKIKNFEKVLYFFKILSYIIVSQEKNSVNVQYRKEKTMDKKFEKVNEEDVSKVVGGALSAANAQAASTRSAKALSAANAQAASARGTKALSAANAQAASARGAAKAKASKATKSVRKAGR